MLPRVALQYGQISCAASIRSRVSAALSAGIVAVSLTARPNPAPSRPSATSAATVEPATDLP